MAYAQSKIVKKRLQDRRRASGASFLRDELNNEVGNGSLLDDLPAFQQNKGVMMANFEEWIKMATDNKINTTNSWNFALIDYFHDLSVLREKDNNINFQKASATLDGCVKIYSSRVDSVATETGRLLSGLATRRQDKEGTEQEIDEQDESDPDNDDIEEEIVSNKGDDAKRAKKKSKGQSKDAGSTLTSFNSIKVKKLSQEWSIDPLFKKTLAEFDEGGAKSLLLNALHMDGARVVFDTSSGDANTEVKDEAEKEQEHLSDQDDEIQDLEMSGIDDGDIDLSSLKHIIYATDEDLESKTLCPSFDHLKSVLKDVKQAKEILNDVNKFQTNETSQEITGASDDSLDFGDVGVAADSFGDIDDEAVNVIFNEDDEGDNNDEHKDLEPGDDNGTQDLVTKVVDQDLMAYFDNTMKRNWAGPEHWKVRQLKKERAQQIPNEPSNEKPKVKKTKKAFKIDFITEDDEKDEKKIFAKGKASISLPLDSRESADSNLLPDDMYFASDQLVRLFLKPNERINIFQKTVIHQDHESNENLKTEVPDADFWADNYKEKEETEHEHDHEHEHDPEKSFLDDDFFSANDSGDLGFGAGEGYDDVFVDKESMKTSFGTQLITGGARVKSDYVNYSKTAKNVNVKMLKDNMWKALEAHSSTKDQVFSDVVGDIAKMYPQEEKRDLSTSFCFICLLHLANEHGLALENKDGYTDLGVHMQ